MPSLPSRLFNPTSQRHASCPVCFDRRLAMLKNKAGNGDKAANDKDGEPIQLGNELKVSYRIRTTPGTLICELVRYSVSGPSELRVASVECVLECELRFDL
jgi:hypothetical protein